MTWRASSVPAWLPRLDTRSRWRRSAAKGCALFVVSACVSYAFLQPGAPDPAGELEWRSPAEATPVVTASAAAERDPWAPTALADSAGSTSRAPTASALAMASPNDATALRIDATALPIDGEARLAPELVRSPEREPPAARANAATLRVFTGHVPPRGTVFATLASQGVSPGVVAEIAAAMRPVFSFRRARAGDFFALIQDPDGKLHSFEFQRGRHDIYRVERSSGGELVALHSEAPLERRVVQLAGVIERSLFDSIVDLGEGGDLVNEFADIFVWDFDFDRQTRPGDEFRLVYEKYYDRAGFVRYGAILAAQYEGRDRSLTAVFYEDEDGYADYFTPEGNSVRRTFLRAPVRYSRISSRYSNSRLHPVLRVRRPHHGIDYAAPFGTPVWAVADGEVSFVGWSGGFGRLVKIRHKNGYVSYYGHLSRYEAGISIGRQVEQKQVIGYVGSSGLSSGPHVDYRLRVDGRYVDPLKLRLPKGEPIAVKARARFDELKRDRLAQLNAVAPPLVLEAAM